MLAVLILIARCAACWGVNQMAIKSANEGISPDAGRFGIYLVNGQ